MEWLVFSSAYIPLFGLTGIFYFSAPIQELIRANPRSILVKYAMLFTNAEHILQQRDTV